MRHSEHMLEALRRGLGRQPLNLPAGGQLVWGWFIALCRTRTSNGYGPNPISYAEIEAYARLYRWPLEPRHIDVILAMDRVWMDHARAQAGGSTKIVAPNGPGAEMTPDAFDAVFG